MHQLFGKPLASKLSREQAQRVHQLQLQRLSPALDIILLNNVLEESPYVLAKKKACQAINMDCRIHHLPLKTSQDELLSLIRNLNADPQVRAIICQLPLPRHIDPEAIVCSIDKNKDVDGFHPQNLGSLALGHTQAFVPCTPAAVLYLLQNYEIPLEGQNVTILGRSRIVGLPLHLLLSQKKIGATVTLCHSQTRDIVKHCQQADIVISAMGQPHLVQKDWLKTDAVAVDVGITRMTDTTKKSGFTLLGDMVPDIGEHVRAVTPVPGGVGPLTVAMVLQNCLKAWESI